MTTPPEANQTQNEPGKATVKLGRGLGRLIPVSAKNVAVEAAPKAVASAASIPAVSAPSKPTATAVLNVSPVEPPKAESLSGRQIAQVKIQAVVPNPRQPRMDFDAKAIEELADSIRSAGLIQPIVVRPITGTSGRYELIAGERRLRAAIAAGLKKVPVILRDAEDRAAAEIAIIENIQRQDLNIIEEAEGYRTLGEHFNLTQQEVAERVGKARASVANVVRLLDLPDEVKQFVAGKRLSTGHAKVLLGLTDPTEQTVLGRKCVTEEMTVRSLEKLIQRRKDAVDGTQERKRGTPDIPESYVRDLTDRMHQHFGTAVRLTPGIMHANGRHTKGILEIDFYDNDDLDRLLNILGIKVD